jgi:HK97 family phage major capsid protein
MSPELWMTDVYEALAKTGVARRLSTLVEMERETLKLPKISTGLTAAIVGELTTATPQQGTFAQFTLTPQKLVVLTKAFSHELMVNADPAIVPLLTHLATIAFGRKEDEMMFVGSDASVTGWLEETGQEVDMATTEDAITDVDFDDFADLENAIDEQYMPDADVENSGGIGGEARYFFNKKVINVLSKLKGNDNYYWNDVAGKRPNTIHGHKYHRIIDMPSAPAAETAFACFGNPKYTYFGYRPGIFVDVLKEATIDSVDMASSAGMALRLIEYVDTKLIDNNAVAVLKTGATS